MRNNSPRHIPALIRTKQIIGILLTLGVSLSLGPVNAWQQPRQIPQTSSSRPAAAVQQPSPTPLPTPSSSPQASPSATPAAIPLKTATTTKTLSELQARIAEVLGKPE